MSKTGRPTKYTPEMAAEICELVSQRVPVVEICAREDMPDKATLYRWKRSNPEFCANYARAREERADSRQDHIDEIIDLVKRGELPPKAAQVIIDAEKWQMGKEQPKTYGDKITNEITGELAVTDTVDRPPNETRDEWIARRKRELANGSHAVVGTATRAANGRNHS